MCSYCYVMYSYCKVYVFISLCMFRSGYSVSLCCSVYCLCVNVYCTTATGVNPTVVNKYTIYHIISYQFFRPHYGSGADSAS